MIKQNNINENINKTKVNKIIMRIIEEGSFRVDVKEPINYEDENG